MLIDAVLGKPMGLYWSAPRHYMVSVGSDPLVRFISVVRARIRSIMELSLMAVFDGVRASMMKIEPSISIVCNCSHMYVNGDILKLGR